MSINNKMQKRDWLCSVDRFSYYNQSFCENAELTVLDWCHGVLCFFTLFIPSLNNHFVFHAAVITILWSLDSLICKMEFINSSCFSPCNNTDTIQSFICYTMDGNVFFNDTKELVLLKARLDNISKQGFFFFFFFQGHVFCKVSYWPLLCNNRVITW